MQNVYQFTNNVFFGLAEIFWDGKVLQWFDLIFIDLLNWNVHSMLVPYHILQLPLRQLNELRQFNSCLFSKWSTEWWIKVYCLMLLVRELLSSVYLCGITFTLPGLNISSLPTQPQPVHEGKMATLTIS